MLSQVDAQKVNESPYHVIYNHLYYLQDDSYDPSMSARSFPEVNALQNQKSGIKLKQILDGKGLYLDMDVIPKNPNYKDSISGLSKFILDAKEPLIYVEKVNGKWSYSKNTIKAIPALFNETFPFGQNVEVYFSSPFWKSKFIGLKAWQWLCLFVLLIIFVAVFYIVKSISSLLLKLFTKSSRLKKFIADQHNVAKSERIFGLWIAAVVVKYVLPTLQLPPRISSILTKGIEILAVIFFVLLILKIVAVIFDYFGKLADRTENTMDDQLLPVIRKIVSGIIWIIGIVFVLSNLNVNITALLAGLSIGGLALALAAQDTVKNFFGSVMIFLDKPFQIGDWIHFDDVDGVVEEVGIRSTRIRTFSNSLVYVPNAHLADATIDNLGLRKFRRYKTELGITYDTQPEIINLFVEGIKEIINAHPTTRKDYYEVSLNSFGASSLNILLYVFFEADDWSKELRGRHEVMYAIIKLANDIGVRFAFPTQTLHIEEFPEKKSTTPDQDAVSEVVNTKNESLKGIKDYFDKKKSENTNESGKPLGGE